MGKVVTKAKQSPSPLITDIRNGVDLYFGQDILYEWEGTMYWGICQGWRLEGETPVVKVDQFTDFGVATVPIDKVWRIWDVRDEQIEKQKTGIEKIKQHIGECQQRIETKQDMWRKAENAGNWQESELLANTINIEQSFMQGLERALAYLSGDQTEGSEG